MEYRRLNPADLPAVEAFAIEGMRAELYPALRVAPAKVHSLVEHFRRSERDFHIVAFHEGRVVGAIAALMNEMLLFEWAEVHVVMCRATVPGVGRRLIEALMAWGAQQMPVRRTLFPQEFHAPRAMGRLLRMYGFRQTVTTSIHYKD